MTDKPKIPKGTLVKFARTNRRKPTPSEAWAWALLRNKGFGGNKFLRQHPICVLDESGIVQSYILDFYCSKLKLAIELDGAYHPNQKEKDQERDENLLRIGIRTLRVPSRSFFNDKWLFESIEELIRPA